MQNVNHTWSVAKIAKVEGEKCPLLLSALFWLFLVHIAGILSSPNVVIVNAALHKYE